MHTKNGASYYSSVRIICCLNELCLYFLNLLSDLFHHLLNVGKLRQKLKCGKFIVFTEKKVPLVLFTAEV